MPALSNSLRLDTTDVSIRKAFSRLSQASLLKLVFTWLENGADQACVPFLSPRNGGEDPVYSSADSREKLRSLYEDFKTCKADKEDVLNRILSGDWRHGISLRQLAMADTQYLLDHPSSQRWIASKLINTIGEAKQARLYEPFGKAMPYATPSSLPPKLSRSSFLKGLQREIGSRVKSYCYVSRLAYLCITLLRVQIFDTPFPSLRPNNARKGPVGPNTTVYIAFPDNSWFVFTSVAAHTMDISASEGNAMRNLIINALPKAISRPGERYRLKTTSLSAKSLSALSAACDTEHNVTANGGWNIFAAGCVEGRPLRFQGENPDRRENGDCKVLSEKDKSCRNESIGNKRISKPSFDRDRLDKRRRVTAEARFGSTACEADGRGVDVLEIQIRDPFSRSLNPQSEYSQP